MKNTIINSIRLISTTLVGTLLGMSGMMAMHYLSMVFYPLPEGLIMEDQDALNQYMKIAPLGAMILIIVSHASGAFFATIFSVLLSRLSIWKEAVSFKYQYLLLGLLFTYFGWYNLQELTHPDWFKIDLLFYIPAAYLGNKLVKINS